MSKAGSRPYSSFYFSALAGFCLCYLFYLLADLTDLGDKGTLSRALWLFCQVLVIFLAGSLIRYLVFWIAHIKMSLSSTILDAVVGFLIALVSVMLCFMALDLIIQDFAGSWTFEPIVFLLVAPAVSAWISRWICEDSG